MKLVKHVGLALIVALVGWSCSENNTNLQPEQSNQEQQQSPQLEKIQVPAQQAAPVSGELDNYGREPGHAHYGHDHPRQDLDDQSDQTQQIQQGSPMKIQQAPASTEPDKYGRKVGDEHYGHDHPLLDEEKN